MTITKDAYQIALAYIEQLQAQRKHVSPYVRGAFLRAAKVQS